MKRIWKRLLVLVAVALLPGVSLSQTMPVPARAQIRFSSEAAPVARIQPIAAEEQVMYFPQAPVASPIIPVTYAPQASVTYAPQASVPVMRPNPIPADTGSKVQIQFSDPPAAPASLPAAPASQPAYTTIVQTPGVGGPAAGCGDCGANPFCPSGHRKAGLGIHADYLWLSPRGADVPFGQIINAANPLAAPVGSVGVASPDYSTGYRIGAGAQISQNTCLHGAFTWYTSEVDDDLFAETPNAVRSLVTFPTSLNVAADSLAASSHYEINFYTGDLEFKTLLCGCPQYSVHYLVGARYAHLEQEFLGNFTILGTTTVDTKIDFDGAGPRIGIQGDYALKHGLYFYGMGAANLLFGAFDATYLQENIFAGTQARTDFSDDRMVPVMELELGLGWTGPKGFLRLKGGYYVSAWFNTMTTPAWLQGVRGTNFTTNGDNLRDTLTFDGLAASVEVRY